MKAIRIGIFGVRRGAYLAIQLQNNGAEVVAFCDNAPNAKTIIRQYLEGEYPIYDDFDAFLNHGMDAVLLTNSFHEHAEFAIKALEKNIHVLSECLSNATMAEGVALVRAAEKSKAIYMLAENYPYMRFNREMKKVYEGGTLGKILFGEGEYNHPAKQGVDCSEGLPSETAWRATLPVTYYITHSLAPLMYITGSHPKRVSALPIFDPPDENGCSAKRNGDGTAIITILNDDDSVFRVTGCALFGAHENSYRIACTKGQMENLRGMGEKVMLRYNAWDVPEGMEENNLYEPEDNADLAKNAGHGGGDYYAMKEFLDCIREGRRPQFDEYFATETASVAILGHRSVMGLGQPYDIPDFHYENDRKKYENDWATPFYYRDGREPNIPCCSRPYYKPGEKRLENYRRNLEKWLANRR